VRRAAKRKTLFIINRAGEKVSPREVEEVLLRHPSVREAVSFAVPDTRLGEDVGAAIVLREDARVSESELRNFAATSLADFKVPRQIFFLRELPKGPTGKLQRIGLADRLKATEKPDSIGRLQEIWRSVLKISRSELDDNFFEAGGDSLSALELQAEIERQFGIRMSLVVLFEAPTIRGLAARINDGNTARPERVAAIQPGGTRPPFFCIGAGVRFRKLALALGADQPFLAPQYPLLSELPVPFRIEDIARSHVVAIRGKQSEGPYFLGGWCTDGIVAYEVAQQLQADRQDVSLLVMFDTVAIGAGPAGVPPHLAPIRNLLSRGQALMEDVWYDGWRSAPSHVRDRLRNFQRLLNHRRRLRNLTSGSAADGDYEDIQALQQAACKSYKIQPYGGTTLLIRSRRWGPGIAQGEDYGWRSLISGQFEVHTCDANHLSMFDPPQVTHVASALRSALQDAQDHRRRAALSPAEPA
jgi:oxalate---CoA ligase